MRFDPIDKTAVSVKCKNTVGAVTGYTLRMEFEVYHLTLQDHQISSINAISTVLTSHWEIPAAHDGKRMEYSWESWTCLTKRLLVWDR